MAVRNVFGLVFTLTIGAILLIGTGLMGYSPPAHMSLDPATWRRGAWTGEIILSQVALGIAFLTVAAVVAARVNRRLGNGSRDARGR
jgi:hypothetical protein